MSKGVGVDGLTEWSEVFSALSQQIHCGFDSALDGTFVFSDAKQDREIEWFLVDDAFIEFHALGLRSGFQQVENGQSELTFNKVGAECFTDDFLGTHEVEAVVINLISGAEFHSVAVEASLGGSI